MAQYYDYEGFVEEVGETQVVGKNGFTKRDVLLGDELNPTSQWPHRIAFTMKKDNCSLLDGVQKGQRAKVRFAIDSRVWNDPKTGKNRFFTDLTALKFDDAPVTYTLYANGERVFADFLDRKGKRQSKVPAFRLRKGVNEIRLRVDHSSWERQFAFDLVPCDGDDLSALRYGL